MTEPSADCLDSRPMASVRSGPTRSSGFTLLELMVVITIMGIVAMAAAPALNSTLQEARLSAATGAVMDALDFGRMTAMTSGRGTCVMIGPIFETLEVQQYTNPADLFDGAETLPANTVEDGNYVTMQYPLKKGVEYDFRLGDEGRFKGADIVTSDFGHLSKVLFDVQGVPSRGGTVRLALGGLQTVVTLDGVTGNVTASN